MTHVYKSRVQTRQYFPYTAEKNISNRKPIAALVSM